MWKLVLRICRTREKKALNPHSSFSWKHLLFLSALLRYLSCCFILFFYSNGKFEESCERIKLPDDCTVGFISGELKSFWELEFQHYTHSLFFFIRIRYGFIDLARDKAVDLRDAAIYVCLKNLKKRRTTQFSYSGISDLLSRPTKFVVGLGKFSLL